VASGGGSPQASATTCATVAAPTGGLPGMRVLSRNSPSGPASAKRCCRATHRATDIDPHIAWWWRRRAGSGGVERTCVEPLASANGRPVQQAATPSDAIAPSRVYRVHSTARILFVLCMKNRMAPALCESAE
jgi:hypothetical protein